MRLSTFATVGLVGLYALVGVPMQAQIVMSIMFVAVGILVTRLIPEYRMISVILSIAISLRYIVWRGTDTINFSDGAPSLILSVMLYLAECYTTYILLAGYFQNSVFLDRRPVPLPDDKSRLPTVDVYIPTYNEGVDIVRRTLVGAMAMDYPHKRVFLLDDGRREEMKALAAECGAQYLIRDNNKGAKAGNLNAALRVTSGELVAIFDADHVPTRSFLDLTVGFFLENENLALVQTPHHFYNPDPFERNLYAGGMTPPEQSMFYHLVQVSNDFWNSTFFCGSCAVLRRKALEEVDGVAQDTVTEDAHTALRMQNRGWDTAYLNLPQAAGLATERFSAYVSQRIRWARGMAQILRIDLPLLNSGLRWYQRINYTIAASHFFFGLPRLVFILAPVTYLAFGLNPLDEDVRKVLVYAIPHLILGSWNSSAANGNQRHSFWPEVYETAIAPYTAWVTLVALVAPRTGAFNVTPKGSRIDQTTFDWQVVWPSLVMAFYCIVGMAFFPLRVRAAPDDFFTLLVALGWNVFNVVILGAAIAVAIERPQRRTFIRIARDYPMVVEPAALSPVARVQEDAEDVRSLHGDMEALGHDEVDEQDDDEPLVLRPVTEDAPIPPDYESVRYRTGIQLIDPTDVPSLPAGRTAVPEDADLEDGSFDTGTFDTYDAPQWRTTGRMIDLCEEGIRFRIRERVELPEGLRLTIFGEDGEITRVVAKPLRVAPDGDGMIVRCRFPAVTDQERHSLIRLMFSSPNAWSRDRYAHDRPLVSLWRVATSPFTAFLTARGWRTAPPEYQPPEDGSVHVHEAVLQCYHCGGVLFRPAPQCPHCGEPLLAVTENYGEISDDVFDAPVPAPWVRRWRERGVAPYLMPAILLSFAFIVAIGGDEIAGFVGAPATEEEAKAIRVERDIEVAAGLARELRRSLESDGDLASDWSSRLAVLGRMYPKHVTEMRDRREDTLVKSVHDLSALNRRRRAGEPAAPLQRQAELVAAALESNL